MWFVLWEILKVGKLIVGCRKLRGGLAVLAGHLLGKGVLVVLLIWWLNFSLYNNVCLCINEFSIGETPLEIADMRSLDKPMFAV